MPNDHINISLIKSGQCPHNYACRNGPCSHQRNCHFLKTPNISEEDNKQNPKKQPKRQIN